MNLTTKMILRYTKAFFKRYILAIQTIVFLSWKVQGKLLEENEQTYTILKKKKIEWI